MRVLFDLRLAAYQPAGIGRSAIRLATGLARVPGLELTTIEAARRPPLPLPAGIRRRRVITPPHFRWEVATLTVELTGRPRAIAHWPDFVPGARGPGRTVLTIHDLAFLRHPELVTPASRAYYGRLPAEARRADHVIAVSEATRADAIETLGLDPDRITAIPHGLDPEFRPDPSPDDAAIRSRLGVAEPYLLFVGTIEPRKNVGGLIRAFDRARRGGLDPDLRLVLAGGRGWLSDDVYRAAYAGPVRSRIIFTGRFADADLPALYRGARALVLPSIDEGFGLPVLEALGCGTPVIASDLPALREVAGDLATFVPVGDEAALAEALLAAGDPTRRADARARGPARAAGFTWDRAVAATAGVYRRLA